MTNLITILAGADSEASSGGSILSFLLLPLMLVAMYFLIIRPNSKRRKEAAALQSVLQVGDEVITTSGIIGTITGEDGPTRFWLEIDDDVQVRIARGGISGRLTDDKNEPESQEEHDADEEYDDVLDHDADSGSANDGRRRLMKRRLWLSLLVTTISVIAIFVANIATGTTPLLGLDLQGGASVILEPAEDASGEDLTVVRDLIRDELERSGIAEPNVRVQGDTIVVELPGVKDQQAALDAVDVSGIVELRPVVNFGECSGRPGRHAARRRQHRPGAGRHARRARPRDR